MINILQTGSVGGNSNIQYLLIVTTTTTTTMSVLGLLSGLGLVS